LDGCARERAKRAGIQSADRGEVVIPLDGRTWEFLGARGPPIVIGSVSNRVTQAEAEIRAPAADVGEDGLQGLKVAVDVGEDGVSNGWIPRSYRRRVPRTDFIRLRIRNGFGKSLFFAPNRGPLHFGQAPFHRRRPTRFFDRTLPAGSRGGLADDGLSKKLDSAALSDVAQENRLRVRPCRALTLTE